MAVREPSSDEFHKFIMSSKCTVVDWTATWCGPCKAIAPVFADMALKNTDATFIKMDVDKYSDLAAKYNISAMPTFQIFKGGLLLGEITGGDPTKLQNLIKQHVTKEWGKGRTMSATPSDSSSPSESIVPRVGSDGKTCKLSIRLLSGQPITKSFQSTDTLETVRRALAVECSEMFVFSMTYPRKKFTTSDESSLTLTQCGLVPNGTLMLSPS